MLRGSGELRGGSHRLRELDAAGCAFLRCLGGSGGRRHPSASARLVAVNKCASLITVMVARLFNRGDRSGGRSGDGSVGLGRRRSGKARRRTSAFVRGCDSRLGRTIGGSFGRLIRRRLADQRSAGRGAVRRSSIANGRPYDSPVRRLSREDRSSRKRGRRRHVCRGLVRGRRSRRSNRGRVRPNDLYNRLALRPADRACRPRLTGALLWPSQGTSHYPIHLPRLPCWEPRAARPATILTTVVGCVSSSTPT